MGSIILDQASVRGLAFLLPQNGIREFGRPISLCVIHSGERSQGRVELADPLVLVAVVQSVAEANAEMRSSISASSLRSRTRSQPHAMHDHRQLVRDSHTGALGLASADYGHF